MSTAILAPGFQNSQLGQSRFVETGNKKFAMYKIDLDIYSQI
jgi:hypothetical protein